ncbi:MAG: hypothetical protein NY202_00835 [Mollicutes bacterium UO1]
MVICGYYETIEVNFMIARHTKFKVDGNFGIIKRLHRKSTINCKEEFVERLNKVQCYENSKGFQTLILSY